MNIPAIKQAVEADDFSFLKDILMGRKAHTLVVEGLKKSVSEGTFPKIHGYNALAKATVGHDAHVTHLGKKGFIEKTDEKTVWVFLPLLFEGLKSEQPADNHNGTEVHSQDAKSKQIFYGVKSRAVENMVVFTDELRKQVAVEVGCRPSYVGQVMLNAEERGLVKLQDRKVRGFGYQIVFLEEAQPPVADPRIVDAEQGETVGVAAEETDARVHETQPVQTAAAEATVPADVSVQSVIQLYDAEIAECDQQIEAENVRTRQVIKDLQVRKDDLVRMRDAVRQKAEQVRESISKK